MRAVTTCILSDMYVCELYTVHKATSHKHDGHRLNKCIRVSSEYIFRYSNYISHVGCSELFAICRHSQHSVYMLLHYKSNVACFVNRL